jgi:hypothetical protein
MPMNRTNGIIIVDADPRDTDADGTTLLNIMSFGPYADMNVSSRMKFSASDLVVKIIDHKGRLTTTHYRSGPTGDYERVPAEEEE